jgi:hypothetical protein
MKANEVNSEIIGKRCKCIFTGLMVTGTIEDIRITEYTAEVKVCFDEPHRWGDELYETQWAHARLHDDFGSLHHLEIIDDGYRTIRVCFSDSIRKIDGRFAQDYKNWGAVNLKEWIDSYESSRFTQIDGRTAIITSEYNMEHIEEWLQKNSITVSITKII